MTRFVYWEPFRCDPVVQIVKLGIDAGLEPGMEGTMAAPAGDEVVLDAGDHEVRLLRTVAETVSVVAYPSPPPRVALPEQLVLSRERYGR